MATIFLPPRVPFNIAITALDLSDLPLIDAADILLMYIGNLKLNIFVAPVIYGQQMSHPVEEILDGDGELVRVLSEGASYCSKDTTILSGHSYMDGNNLRIAVFSFIHNGVGYYTLDEAGMYLESQSFSVNDLYLEKVNLETVMAAVGSNSANRKPSSPLKKLPIQKKRETAFITWLCSTQTNTRRTEDRAILQEYYKKFGSPTQKEVWGHLKRFDPELFKSGKDDFFRNLIFVNFLLGTSKGR